MKDIFIGTSGYTYKDWKEKFYPLHFPQHRWLSYYSSQFKTVEINATFYRNFPRSTYRKWYEQTPHEFRFTIKGPRFITQLKQLHDVATSVALFFEDTSSLREKLAVVLWQFPQSFKNTDEQRERLENFFPLLPQTIKQVVELRDESWFTHAAFALFENYKISWTINDSSVFPASEKVTGPIVYIRFHGPKGLYASSYSHEQIEKWAEKIVSYAKGKEVYAYFNNDISGYAIENARTLLQYLSV